MDWSNLCDLKMETDTRTVEMKSEETEDLLFKTIFFCNLYVESCFASTECNIVGNKE